MLRIVKSASVMVEALKRRRRASIALLAVLLAGCSATQLSPLGSDSIIYRGSTGNQNKFDVFNTPDCPTDDIDAPSKIEPPRYKPAGDPPLTVLALIADVNDFRYTGSDPDLTVWRDAKLADYESNTRAFWKDASFDDVQVDWEMPSTLLHMSGAFDDYFNRPFVAASLTTRGLAGSLPLTLDGSASATFHVRDASDRNVDVIFAPSGTFADVGALVVECQTVFDASPSVPSPWVTCSDEGGELHMQLANLETKEASFIRVKSGAGLANLGLEGPSEAPGNGSQGALVGLPVTFPVSLAGTESVKVEVRDKDNRTRTVTVNLPAATVANPNEVADLLLPALNSELNWVESFAAGGGRLGLRIVSASNGENASIRIVGGTGHASLGLQGPTRVDGVVTQKASRTVRGDRKRIVGEALSLLIAARAAATGIAVTSAKKSALDTLVNTELGGFDSFMVLFVESTTGVPGRRAGAGRGPYDIRIEGAGGYVYKTQVDAALLIGTGDEPWETWAHELGHNLGMWDIYKQPHYDVQYDAEFDYLGVWSIMNNHLGANHPDGWHKRGAGWLPAGSIEDIAPPPAAGKTTTKFTLLPLEFEVADYAGVASATYPARQLARIELSPEHWLLLENRQPASSFSVNLPDDVVGHAPADPSGEAGGLLVTDTVEPGSNFLYRSPVTTLNPHGSGSAPPSGWLEARGVADGETFDPISAFPAYDGIEIRVVGTTPGPPGKPEALQVEVDRGPGDYLDLRIRPWHAPNVYGTPDIWIDWPGNGVEDYSTVDPPIGNGDATHWHPDGAATNQIKVRVHNEGTIDAEDVVIRAFVNEPMGMGAQGKFVALPDSAPAGIPAGGFIDFSFDWKPTSAGHTCVRAEVFTHSSALGELDVSNNEAQENVNDFAPTAGSPYAPVEFDFKVDSDFPYPVEVEFHASGLPPGMDLELERDWIELAPNEERILRGRLTVDENLIPPAPESRRACRYRFNLHAFLRTEDHLLPFGGITVQTHPSYGSELVLRSAERVKSAAGVAAGASVGGMLKGQWSSGQPVDAIVVGGDGVSYSGTGTTNGSGVFTVQVPGVPPGPARVMLYYFGPDLSPSTLGPVPIQL